MYSVIKCFLKVLEFLWPPVRTLRANRVLNKQIKKLEKQSEKLYQEIFDEFVKKKNSKFYSNELFSEIEKIEQAEVHRKEVFESKASLLINILAVAVALIVLVSGILGTNWGLPQYLATVATLLFTLAVIHLLISVYYAARVTEVGLFHMVSAESIGNFVRERPENFLISAAAQKLANVKLNQPRLIIKSNFLVTAQKLFIRGITFLGIGALVVLFYGILE